MLTGCMPCSKQNNSQAALPIWHPACPIWRVMTSRCKSLYNTHKTQYLWYIDFSLIVMWGILWITIVNNLNTYHSHYEQMTLLLIRSLFEIQDWLNLKIIWQLNSILFHTPYDNYDLSIFYVSISGLINLYHRFKL